MGKTWPKLIRDPVHDIISFEDKPWDHLLIDLIKTREFQRLRRIKQLGMSEMVFPGANHSRFAHSIGVMHNARRFLTRIEQLTSKTVADGTPWRRRCSTTWGMAPSRTPLKRLPARTTRRERSRSLSMTARK